MGKSPNRCFLSPFPRAVKIHWSSSAGLLLLLLVTFTACMPFPLRGVSFIFGSIGLAQRSSHCSVNWGEHCNIDRAAHMWDGGRGRGRTCDMGERFQRRRGLQGDQRRKHHSRGNIVNLGSLPNVKGVDNRGASSFTLYIWQFYAPIHLVHLPPLLGTQEEGEGEQGRTQFISPKNFPSPIRAAGERSQNLTSSLFVPPSRWQTWAEFGARLCYLLK